MKKHTIIMASISAVASILLAACAQSPQTPAAPTSSEDAEVAEASFDRSSHFITILTGPTSGIFYPIGGGFFQVANAAGYPASVTATGASVANINALLGDNGELAISQVDAAVQAFQGTHAFDGSAPATELRAVMGLWPQYVQIVTTADSGIQSFEDLRGRRVGLGAPGSGVELNARMIFAAHDMTYEDIIADFLSYGEAIDQMRNGLVDAAFVTTGLGNATIMELGIDHEIFFIPVDGEARQRLVDQYPFYLEFVIPTEAYGTAVPTETVGLMNILLTHEGIPSYVIYDLLENFLSDEGLSTIQATHAQANQHISLDFATRGIYGIPVPIHDGALEFFQNRGLLP